jgi:type IV secretory pathway protease TraF
MKAAALQKTDGHFRRIAGGLIGCGSISVGFLCAVASVLGVRVNTSYSLPMGFYIETSGSATSLVEFCPTGTFGRQSSERRYRIAGFACADGAVPLLKPIIAREGDLVETTPHGIKVNGTLLTTDSASGE